MGETRYHDLGEINIQGEGPDYRAVLLAALIGTAALTFAALRGKR